jgi:F-type H+-transporting ATPase subunit b
MNTTIVAAASASNGSLLIPEVPDLLWGTVGFVVVLVVFIRVALPRLNTLLDERSKAIEGRIDEAKHAREEAESILETYQQQLAEARTEAGRIREAARDDAKRIRAELVEQAQAEAARIVAQARTQIQSERDAAVQSLRAEVGSLALDLASAVVTEHLATDANAKAFVDRFLEDLQIEHASDGRVQ